VPPGSEVALASADAHGPARRGAGSVESVVPAAPVRRPSGRRSRTIGCLVGVLAGSLRRAVGRTSTRALRHAAPAVLVGHDEAGLVKCSEGPTLSGYRSTP
jgi:hypothetical protein